MALAIIFATIALALAFATGGSIQRLASTSFRWTGPLALGLAAQLIASFWRSPWVDAYGLWLVLFANAVLAVFLYLNRHLPGMLLAAVGLTVNVLVIGINQGMPVSVKAIEIAGAPKLTPEAEHIRLDDSSKLPWLTDVIPIPVAGAVVSAGDVALASGIGLFIYRRMKSEDQTG